MRFEFATVTKIIFGQGALKDLVNVVASYGRRAFVVTGSKPERAAPLVDLLNVQKVSYHHFASGGEPSVDDVRGGTSQAQGTECDFVIAFGGGAVLDTGKAIAALLTNPGDPLDYLEVIGAGK